MLSRSRKRERVGNASVPHPFALSTNSNPFYSSLCSFLQSAGEQAAGRLTLDELRRWSSSSRWRAVAKRLAPNEQVRALAALGRRIFDSDLGGYRTDLEFNVQAANPSAGR